MDYAEEDYFNTRKDAKQLRKLRGQMDKSTPKKEEPMPEGLPEGRVISIRSEAVDVAMPTGVLQCTIKGSLKQHVGRIKNIVTIGDRVLVDETQIAYVLPRTSVLSRIDPKNHRQEQLLAANIDQVLITLSAQTLKPHLADRFIIAARQGNMHPLLVVNKIDLAYPEEFIELYRSLGYTVLPVSALSGKGIKELKAALKGKTSVFAGQSGTGKSSLINRALGANLRTAEIVAWNEKGSHTTTAVTLIPVEGGGYCLDTPGIRSLGIMKLERGDLIEQFPEIAALKCRFADCTHQGEPGCAIENGTVHPMRYDSYCKLQEEINSVRRPGKKDPSF